MTTQTKVTQTPLTSVDINNLSPQISSGNSEGYGLVITTSNTGVHPLAMVVKIGHALVADATVFGTVPNNNLYVHVTTNRADRHTWQK